MASINLHVTFCFNFNVSSAPSVKSQALSILTTFPCALHHFLGLSQLPKAFLCFLWLWVFTSSLDYSSFPSKPGMPRPSLLHFQALSRVSQPPGLFRILTLLPNFWYFCCSPGTGSATFGGSQTLISLWIDSLLIFIKPTIFYSVESTSKRPDLSKNQFFKTLGLKFCPPANRIFRKIYPKIAYHQNTPPSVLYVFSESLNISAVDWFLLCVVPPPPSSGLVTALMRKMNKENLCKTLHCSKT